MRKSTIGLAALALLSAQPAMAKAAFSCGGFAMLGGAELLCSHVDPEAPPQLCTFTWNLMGSAGPSMVTGTFLLPPGAANLNVYQGSGFSYALASPIVLCQGRHS